MFVKQNTTIWARYPSSYRSSEISQILPVLQAGECISIIGLSGAGKSNLLGFLANRQDLFQPCPRLVLVDCNRMQEATPKAFIGLLRLALTGIAFTEPGGLSIKDDIVSIDRLLASLQENVSGISLLIDRFDLLAGLPEPALVYGNLRALRDSYKYWLTLAPASRRPLDDNTELAELCYANILWLGPLSEGDAHWTIQTYAERVGIQWDAGVERTMLDFSWGYPSLLRAICEAYASGAPLDLPALRTHPAVERRVAEFWADGPDAQALQKSRLAGHPLLGAPAAPAKSAPVIDSAQLTAKEHSLWEYLQSHPDKVLEKDELIQAIWPEDKIFMQGVRDDSLAQLIRRLRVKLEPNPAEPTYIRTIPGRGYRYTPG